MIGKTKTVIAMVACAGLLAGCAGAPAPVSFVYAPSMEAKGGSGELFLKSASCGGAPVSPGKLRWVVGTRKNSDGKETGEILSTLSAEDMVLDALKRELAVAGYRVECGTTMPAGVAKGLDLAALKVDIEETAGVSRVEANGRVQISLDIWKNGNKVRRVSYQSKISDFAVLDRDRLPRELIEQGLHEVMRQATPEIVTVLEGKQ